MKTQNFTIKEKDKIILDIADIRLHMDVMNNETGELRDSMREMKNDFNDRSKINGDDIGDLKDDVSTIKVNVSQVRTDVSWLKQTYWIIAGASVGGLIMAFFNLIVKK